MTNQPSSKAFADMTTVRISRESLAALQAKRIDHAKATGESISLSATIAVLLGLPREASRTITLQPRTTKG